MEDEDYFQFQDDILINSGEQLVFRDSALSVGSSTDGQLDIDADTEVEITKPSYTLTAKVFHWSFVFLFAYGISKQDDNINQLEKYLNMNECIVSIML